MLRRAGKAPGLARGSVCSGCLRLGRAQPWAMAYPSGLVTVTQMRVCGLAAAAWAKSRARLVAATAAIGFAGFFAVDSYIAPVTTSVTGLSPGAVAWVLVAVGLGMTVGNALGGWYADRDPRRATLLGFTGMIIAAAFFALAAGSVAGLFAGAFLVGATSLFLGPVLQSRLIAAAPGAQLMGAAVNQSAMNIANSLGAALGSVVIAAGLGYRAPAWAGAALAAVGLTLPATGFAVDRRTAANPAGPAPGTGHAQPRSQPDMSH